MPRNRASREHKFHYHYPLRGDVASTTRSTSASLPPRPPELRGPEGIYTHPYSSHFPAPPPGGHMFAAICDCQITPSWRTSARLAYPLGSAGLLTYALSPWRRAAWSSARPRPGRYRPGRPLPARCDGVLAGEYCGCPSPSRPPYTSRTRTAQSARPFRSLARTYMARQSA